MSKGLASKGRRGRVCAASKLPGHLSRTMSLPPPLPQLIRCRCHSCRETFTIADTPHSFEGSCPHCKARYRYNREESSVGRPNPIPQRPVALMARIFPSLRVEVITLRNVVLGFKAFRAHYPGDPETEQGMEDFAWFYYAARLRNPQKQETASAVAGAIAGLMHACVPPDLAMSATMLAVRTGRVGNARRGPLTLFAVVCGLLVAERIALETVDMSALRAASRKHRYLASFKTFGF